MDETILKGKELLEKINSLSEKTQEFIIEECGYSLKFGFGRSSKRAFFRNLAEAYLKYGEKKYFEKDGPEFKKIFFFLRLERKKL